MNLSRKWTIVLVFTAAGCSSFSHKAQSNTQAIETRDVPVVARGEDEAPRNRLLVLPFLDERPERNVAMTDMARQTVVHELLRGHQFVILSPEDFPQDPKKFLSEENEYDLAQISRIASGIGVAAVVEGKILAVKIKRVGSTVGVIRNLKAQVTVQVRVRIYAGKNGKEILNEVRTADVDASSTRMGERGDLTSLNEDPDLVRAGVAKAFAGSLPNISRAVDKLNWEGRVAMVAGERVYVNAGRLTGLQVGDILKVLEDGDDVYDPETGRFIGTAPGRLKGTIEVVSYFGKDGSIAVIHSGSGFQENDRVELY